VAVMLIPEIALRRVGPGALARLLARLRGRWSKGGPAHESPTSS
jgi:hypothetical protein